MNKIRIFLAAILLAGIGTSSAWAEGKIAIGVQGGITLPDFYVKNATFPGTYGNRDGWLAGMFLEFGVWSITLRPELNYVIKGYSVANTADVTNRYLEVPVLLKINPLSDSVISPFLLLGPQWSKHLGSKVETRAGAAAYTNTVTDWDLSGIAGLGIELNISEHVGLNIQGRYSYGFRDVDSSATEIRTRGFYALAGLSIQDAF
ncbi:MAG TPA: outer membrane beta-barrel protein [Bdellovibrionota bacterium]|jgi:hypothetical protein